MLRIDHRTTHLKLKAVIIPVGKQNHSSGKLHFSAGTPMVIPGFIEREKMGLLALILAVEVKSSDNTGRFPFRSQLEFPYCRLGRAKNRKTGRLILGGSSRNQE